MEPLKVMLSSEQDQALRAYFYNVAKEEINRIRQDEKLNLLVYTRKNLAKACGCSPSLIDTWQKMGLKCSVINGRNYYTKKDVEEFIATFRI